MSRDDFEAWWLIQPTHCVGDLSVDDTPEARYVHKDVQKAWAAWQAALTSTESIRTERYEIPLENGGYCKLTLDLVNGKCASKEEASDLVDWLDRIIRRIARRNKLNSAVDPSVFNSFLGDSR